MERFCYKLFAILLIVGTSALMKTNLGEIDRLNDISFTQSEYEDDFSFVKDNEDELESLIDDDNLAIEHDGSTPKNSLLDQSLLSSEYDFENLAKKQHPFISGVFDVKNIEKLCPNLKGDDEQVNMPGSYENARNIENSADYNNFTKLSQRGTISDNVVRTFNEKSLYCTIKAYNEHDFNYFKNEIMNIYHFEIKSSDASNHVVSYLGCQVDDKGIYIITADTENMYQLSSSFALGRLSKLSGSNLKTFYINLTEVIQNLHEAGVAHGSLTLDSILVSEDLKVIKLQNFKRATNLEHGTEFINVNREYFMNAVMPSNESVIYNDLIDLLFIFVFLDNKVFQTFFDNEIAQLENYLAESFKEFPAKSYLSYLLNEDNIIMNMSDAIIRSMRKAKKKDFFNFDFNFFENFRICCGAASHKENVPKISCDIDVVDNCLQNGYIDLIKMDSKTLSVSSITQLLSSTKDSDFVTWVTGKSLKPQTELSTINKRSAGSRSYNSSTRIGNKDSKAAEMRNHEFERI